MESTTMAVRNGQFDIEVLREGQGAPLLYLHGEAGIDESAFLDGLAENHAVIAPRHPGMGRSTGDDHLEDLHDLLYYYLDFLDEAGLRDLGVVGHGLGGMFALELAAMQPERFTKLAVIAPFGLWNPDYPVPDFFTFSPDDLIRASFHEPESQAASALAMPQSEGDVHGILERVKSQRVAAKYLWPIPNRGLKKRIHRVRPQTLLIWGESDGIVPPQYASDFAGLLPSASVKSIAGAGHLPQLEKPSDVLGAIRELLG
jgi:pimeloyl-ACP methyl ester carboxylesterase